MPSTEPFWANDISNTRRMERFREIRSTSLRFARYDIIAEQGTLARGKCPLLF